MIKPGVNCDTENLLDAVFRSPLGSESVHSFPRLAIALPAHGPRFPGLSPASPALAGEDIESTQTLHSPVDYLPWASRPDKEKGHPFEGRPLLSPGRVR
jgi:hypothetical protein